MPRPLARRRFPDDAPLETLPVRWLTPAAAAFLLNERARGVLPVPVGDARIEALAADALQARGPRPALAALAQALARLDAPARNVRVALRLVPARFDAGSLRPSAPVRELRLVVGDGEPLRLNLSARGAIGFTAVGTVRLADGTVTSSLALVRGRIAGPPPERPPVPLASGDYVPVAGWTADPDPARQAALAAGTAPESGAGDAYLLEARLLEAPPSLPTGSRRDVVALRHLEPAEALALVPPDPALRPLGEPARKAVRLDGPRAALDAWRSRVDAVDRAPASARVALRVVRVDYPERGLPKETVLREETRETLDGAVEVGDPLAGWSARARVLPQPDGAAWVFGDVRSRSIPKEIGAAPVVLRGGIGARLRKGQARRVGGVVRTDDPRALDVNPARRQAAETIARGEEPRGGRPIAAIVLDVVLLP